MPKGKQQNRMIPILLAIVAAVGLVIAAFGPRWLADPDHADIGFGLTTFEECVTSTSCKSGSIAELLDKIDAEIAAIQARNETLPPREQIAAPKKPWRGFPVVGMIAFIGCLVAAGGLIVGAVVALAGKRPVVPVMPTTLAVLGLFFAIVAGCVFVATKPVAVQSMEVGWSFMTFGGAIVVGLGAVFPLNRLIRPIDDELGAASATMSWGTNLDEQ
jgi:hypothetical protein